MIAINLKNRTFPRNLRKYAAQHKIIVKLIKRTKMKHIFTTFKQFMTKPLLLALTLLAMSSNAWGQTYNGGAWYSLYDANEYSKSTTAGGEIHTYSDAFLPHDGTFSFDSKLPGNSSGKAKSSDPKDYGITYPYSIKFGDISTPVYSNISSSKSTNKDWFGRYTWTYTYNYSHVTGSGLPATSTSFKAYYEYNIANALFKTVYIKNVKIPLAKHILLDNGGNGTTSVTKTFANTSVENYSDPIAINLRSFLTNANIGFPLGRNG